MVGYLILLFWTIDDLVGWGMVLHMFLVSFFFFEFLSFFFNKGTNTFTEFERNMAKVERVLEYVALEPEEAEPTQLTVL